MSERLIACLLLGVGATFAARAVVAYLRPIDRPAIVQAECVPSDPAMPDVVRAQFLKRCAWLPRYRPVGDWP